MRRHDQLLHPGVRHHGIVTNPKKKGWGGTAPRKDECLPLPCVCRCLGALSHLLGALSALYLNPSGSLQAIPNSGNLSLLRRVSNSFAEVRESLSHLEYS